MSRYDTDLRSAHVGKLYSLCTREAFQGIKTLPSTCFVVDLKILPGHLQGFYESVPCGISADGDTACCTAMKNWFINPFFMKLRDDWFRRLRRV